MVVKLTHTSITVPAVLGTVIYTCLADGADGWISGHVEIAPVYVLRRCDFFAVLVDYRVGWVGYGHVEAEETDEELERKTDTAEENLCRAYLVISLQSREHDPCTDHNLQCGESIRQ